jgi:hypothetical protein
MTVHARLDRRGAQELDETALQATSNSELDTIFRISPPGRLPAQVLRGTVLLFPGSRACQVLAHVLYWVAWQGKVVAPTEASLLNRITPLRLRRIKAEVAEGRSWVDDKPCVVIDYSRTSVVARAVRDETREVAPGLHLGVVWLRHRRVAWFTLRATARS